MKNSLKDGDFKTSSMCHPRLLPPCVAVAIQKDEVAVRDTKDSTKTTLVFTYEEWDVFIKCVKNGEFDLPS